MNSEIFVWIPISDTYWLCDFFQISTQISVSSLEKGNNTTKLPETAMKIKYVKIIEHAIDASAYSCISTPFNPPEM